MAEKPKLTGPGSEELPSLFEKDASEAPLLVEIEVGEEEEIEEGESTTVLRACSASRCMFWDRGACTLVAITVGEKGDCDQFEPRQETNAPYEMSKDQIPMPPEAAEE